MPADVVGVRTALQVTFSPTAARVAASSGLQLRGPFRNGDVFPLFLLKNVTAGVFAGDRYDVSLTAEAGAHARVSSASATKVHAMPRGRAQSHLSIFAAAGSRIVYDAAPLILQAGSDLYQTTRIVAEPGATAVVSEIVVFGRLARGERFAFRRFSSELSLTQRADEPAHYTQRFTLTPGADDAIDTAMRGYGVLGAMVAVASHALDLLASIRSQLAEIGDCYAGASLLPGDDAVILQVLAERPDAVARVLRSAEGALLRD